MRFAVGYPYMLTTVPWFTAAHVASFLRSELLTCQKWLIDNRLSLHLGKTECILFGSRRRLKDSNFTIQLGDITIKRVTSVRYLGVLLDQFLDFSDHVEQLLKKANSKLAVLVHNRHSLNPFSKKLLCQALVFSNLEYCTSAWYPGLGSGLRESLNVLQRKCARFCLNLSPRSHIGNDEFSMLGWLPFSKRVSFFNLIHAYKVRAGTSPLYLEQSFTRVDTVHTHNLRQSTTNFSLARCSSPVGTFCRNAVSDWNSLPRELKEIRSLSAFKSSLRRYLKSV